MYLQYVRGRAQKLTLVRRGGFYGGLQLTIGQRRDNLGQCVDDSAHSKIYALGVRSNATTNVSSWSRVRARKRRKASSLGPAEPVMILFAPRHSRHFSFSIEFAAGSTH